MTLEDNSPLLTPEEEELLKELRDEISKESVEEPIRRWLTDGCLCRYLRARQWNVSKAAAMLKDTIAWRTEYKPQDITWDQVAHEAETGKMYISPYKDNNGHTVLIMRPGMENTVEHDGKIKYLVFCLEACVRSCLESAGLQYLSGHEPGRGSHTSLAPEQLCIVCDYTGWSLSNAPPLKTSVETVSILQNHYPERLGVSIITNHPSLFSMFWTMISPFVDTTTKEKIQFINQSSSSRDQKLSKIIQLENLEEGVGGKSKYLFDFQTYGQVMTQLCAA